MFILFQYGMIHTSTERKEYTDSLDIDRIDSIIHAILETDE